jgi:uncharacterized membrane protein SirB2
LFFITTTLFVKIGFKGSGVNPINNYYFLALLPPVILLVVGIIILNYGDINSIIWLISLLDMVIIYIFNWEILDLEIKNRFKDPFSNLFGNTR